jgi:hypothetical protein
VQHLVLAGGGLAGLELLKVPVADLHVAVVVIHALGEALGGAGAVVAPFAVLRLRVDGALLRGLLDGAAATAREETADGVADGGADRDTAARTIQVSSVFS